MLNFVRFAHTDVKSNCTHGRYTLCVMSDLHERLRRARVEAGFSTASEAVRRFGWNKHTYAQHENGTRGFKRETADDYAKAFKVSAAWLLTGENRAASNTLPVVGFVGAGAEVFAVDDHAKGAGLEEVEAPPGCPKEAVAVKVRGDSMMDRYAEGDTLIYWRQLPAQDLLYRTCVVGLEDGRRFVKQITPGEKPGTFTLLSSNAAPRKNERVAWAAPIEWIRPA